MESERLISEIAENAVIGIDDKLIDYIQESKEDLARDKSFEIESYLNSVAFTSNLNSFRNSLLLYPSGTRFYHYSNDKFFVLLEDQPQLRTITFDSNIGETRYRISLPYVYHLHLFTIGSEHIQAKGSFIGMSPKKCNSFNDRLCYAFLTNVNNVGQMCSPTEVDWSIENFSISKVVMDRMSNFWNSTFNQDWDYNVKMPLIEWHKKTANDPLFILDDEYYKDSISMLDFMKGATDSLGWKVTHLSEIYSTVAPKIKDKINLIFDSVKDLAPEIQREAQELIEAELYLIYENLSKKFKSSLKKHAKECTEELRVIFNEVAKDVFGDFLKTRAK